MLKGIKMHVVAQEDSFKEVVKGVQGKQQQGIRAQQKSFEVNEGIHVATTSEYDRQLRDRRNY